MKIHLRSCFCRQGGKRHSSARGQFPLGKSGLPPTLPSGCAAVYAQLLPLSSSVKTLSGEKMASQQLCLRLMGLAVLLTLLALRDVSSDSTLHKILRKRDGVGNGPAKSSVALPSSKAQEFLARLSRTKRNIWDRSRPDVQQWIMQFMYMGYDEQRLETDLAYWMDHARANDQGRQHHYDENSPIGPRDPSSYRHGANVNYDYY